MSEKSKVLVVDDKQVERVMMKRILSGTYEVDVYKRQINTLAGFYNSLLTAISYLERIFETIDETVAVRDEPDADVYKRQRSVMPNCRTRTV